MAGKDSSPDARMALGNLYRAYRPAMHSFLRGSGKRESETEELIQGFFEFLLEHRGLEKVRKEGKFRNWLLASLKNFLRDQLDRQRALKRGGGQTLEVLGESREDGPSIDPPHPGRTPDQEFDRQFALRFLELVMERLENEYRTRGKVRHFEALRGFLLDKKGDVPHSGLGLLLGMSEAAVSAEICRLRKRYRSIFDESLGLLVGEAHEIEAEKRHLFEALRA
jgi:RNA polymerase sigma-70 factor (ECF subfamily)